jgi:hypothetical protein
MTDSETPELEPEAPAAETPADPLGKVKGFVEEHPVAMVAGGILLGALVAGAITRPRSGSGESKPRGGSIARTSLPRRALDIAAIGLEMAAAYAAGAAGEKAATSPEPEEGKPEVSRASGLAGKALRTLGPLLARRLPGKKDM